MLGVGAFVVMFWVGFWNSTPTVDADRRRSSGNRQRAAACRRWCFFIAPTDPSFR
jgi:hypothetical protein